MTTMYQIQRKDGQGPSERVAASDLMTACARLSSDGAHALSIENLSEAPVPPQNSTIGGTLVTDDAAKARIHAQHAALRTAGIAVDEGKQLYATGTRMADVGYGTQKARKAEHDAKLPIRDVMAALASTVESEQRDDIECSAAEFGRALSVNGKVSAFGLAVSEQAIRGLATRLESPCLSYVLGIRGRIAAETARGDGADVDAIRADKAQLATILRHECLRAGDVSLKLRTRKGAGDIFAVVSPAYTPADAPELLARIGQGLPSDARGSWAYDPESTSWELRASVWTPTPTNEQCVGEPFEGFVSFKSKDNGAGRLSGGGGVTMLACLNAGTYSADSASVSRTHRKSILVDVGAMLRGSLKAIEVLCEAWGTARDATIEVPTGVRISDAIPGFWRYCLTARGGELAGVLPGRTETHVEGLTRAYAHERRDTDRIVKSDLAQGWTKYIQSAPSDVRRDAESAIGSWLVSDRPVRCEVRA